MQTKFELKTRICSQTAGPIANTDSKPDTKEGTIGNHAKTTQTQQHRDLIGRVHDGRFIALMAYQADRAEALYQEAIDCLHQEDAKALKAAEAMRKIYQTLLKKIKADGFRVFDKRYRLSKTRK